MSIFNWVIEVWSDPPPEQAAVSTEQTYQQPEPTYQQPEPQSTDLISWLFGGGSQQQPQQSYQQSEPTYREPEPTYREPEPTYQEPEPQSTDFFGWLFGGGSQQQEQQETQTGLDYTRLAASKALNIQGDPDFIEKITEAYNRLDSEDQQFVSQNVSRIHQHEKVIGAFPISKIVYVSNERLRATAEANRGDESLAAMLVHEVKHITNGGIANSQQEELECIDKQIKTLQKIGGCPQEIRYLQSLDGNHYLD